METDFKTFANKVINPNGLPSKRKAIIFSFCLLISLFFWLLIKFSREFQLTLLFPVSFVNLPSDKVLMNNQDTCFLVTIKSQGFNLLYFQLFKKEEKIFIDASFSKINSNDSDTLSYLGASQISKLISKQLNFNYEIINILPETYTLHWEKAFTKKLPLKANCILDFEKQYQLYDTIRIEPATISISGTKTDLAHFNFLSTKKLTLNNLNKTQSLYVEVLKPNNYSRIKFFTPKVKLTIPVEKFTEAEIEVNVSTTDNNIKNIKFFPEKVKVTYQVALKDFKKVNYEMFEAVTNIDKSKTIKDINTKVELIKFPSFVKISKIYPEKIEYIIFK
ncbi:MAG: hypothetical protein ACOYO1_17365 [Bacteroidales bacterium]